MNPKVSIIIVNFNGKRFLEKNYSSIFTQSYGNVEVILADNASSDDSIDFTKKNFPKVKIAKLPGNLGYAKGNNEGAKIAIGEYLLFLNNDAWLDGKAIEEAVRKTQEDDGGLYALHQKNYEGTIDYGCILGLDIFGYTNPRKLFYSDGSALFIKKSIFEELGGFDEAYGFFMEDADLSWRARLKGYGVIEVPDSVFYHYGGGTAVGSTKKNKVHTTSIFRRYNTEKNVMRTLLKNYRISTLIFILPFLFLFHFCEIAVLALLMRFDIIRKVYLEAYIWNIRNFRSTLNERKKVQEGRKIGDIEIMKRMVVSYSKIESIINVGFPEIAGK